MLYVTVQAERVSSVIQLENQCDELSPLGFAEGKEAGLLAMTLRSEWRILADTPNEEDTLYLLLTSGTTGVPKLVHGSHEGENHGFRVS